MIVQAIVGGLIQGFIFSAIAKADKLAHIKISEANGGSYTFPPQTEGF